MEIENLIEKIISDYKEHYVLPPQLESTIRNCIANSDLLKNANRYLYLRNKSYCSFKIKSILQINDEEYEQNFEHSGMSGDWMDKSIDYSILINQSLYPNEEAKPYWKLRQEIEDLSFKLKESLKNKEKK